MTHIYAGDVTVTETWQRLEASNKAVLIDVRSNAEWTFVGIPDLGCLHKQTHCIAWQDGPDLAVNTQFVDDVAATNIPADSEVFLICRSGQRSKHAATALTEAGYAHCYNVSGGFEGPLDGERHRGVSGGWKAAGLPWTQS